MTIVNILNRQQFSTLFQQSNLMSAKGNYKIPSSQSTKKPTKRLHTQAIQPSNRRRELSKGSSKNKSKNKYLHVYSKIPKETNNHQDKYKKVFKLNNKATSNPKVLKTQPNELGRKVTLQSSTHTKAQSTDTKYEVDGVAGKGTFGTVYHGHLKDTNIKIAIKKVLQDKRYKNRELQILQTIKNSNVLEIRDHYMTHEGEKQYLNVVMDYFPYNLYQVIKKKQLPVSLIKIYIYQALKGLNYIASLSIAHRDIKPQNILIDPHKNKAVICDFGSAKKLVAGQTNLAYICSRCYRAPQLIFGATDYTPQIDMWSMGCVLVEMINNQPPFVGDSQIDQLIQIIKLLGTPTKQQIFDMNEKYSIEEYKKFPSLKKVNWKSLLYTTDTKLIDLIDKMLQYSPKKRLTPGKALLHEFFDELRNEKAYKELLNKYKNIPELFEFSKEQLNHCPELQKVIPKWYSQRRSGKLESILSKKANRLV